MIYKARDLIAMPKEQLWALPNSKISVEMDDGVIKASRESTIFSVYCWSIHKHYPKTPLLIKHHLGDDQFTSSTMQTLVNRLVWDCVDHYKGKVDRELIERVVGDTMEAIYNDFTYQLEADVKTISILDFIEIMDDPVVKDLNENVEPTHRSVANAQRIVKKLLTTDKKFSRNSLAAGCRSGYLKADQVVQCLTAVGYVTDIDNNIFRQPIMHGLASVYRSLYEFMIETRKASKALGFTKDPLEQSQYFNRRLQILTDTISDIIPGDCGSKQYLTWFVMPEDVESLDGKYYLDEKTKKLKMFVAKTATAEGLVGKELKLRSVLYCQSNHPRGFCETCFGALSWSLPAGSNPGHVACTKLGERVTQILLSTKHIDRNANTGRFEISEDNQKYINYDEERNAIVLASGMDPKKIVLTVEADQAGRLSDVLYVDDVSLLQTSLVSSLTRAQFTITTKKQEENVILPISTGKRCASISREFLEYIKKEGWNLAPNGNYSINLKHWDQDLPLFTLPLKNANMFDYMKSIEHFVMGTKSAISNVNIKTCTTPDEALREFNSIVSTQLKVNIAYLEVMIKACMIRSNSQLDFRPPLPGNKTVFGKFQTIVAGRSMSAVLAYEWQRTIFAAPQTYLIRYRPNHPLDPIVAS